MNIKGRKMWIRTVNLAFTLFFAFLLAFPRSVGAATAQAVTFCIGNIIPALYIYLVFSRRITAITAVTKLCAHPFWGSMFTVALGFLCGCPAGAKNCVFLYESGVISKKRGEYLCCLCSGASIPFILSFAGAYVMGDIKYGLKLLGLLFVSVAVIALAFRPFLLKSEKKPKNTSVNYIRKTDLVCAVSESAFLLVSVCGFIICFYVLGVMVSGIFSEGSIYSLLVQGLFEFSGGIAQSAAYPLPTREVLCGLFLGFGSLSGIFQTVSVINKIPHTYGRFDVAFNPSYLTNPLSGRIILKR